MALVMNLKRYIYCDISFFSLAIIKLEVIELDIKIINRVLHQHQIQKSYCRLDLIISAGIIALVLLLVPIILKMG